MNKNKSKRISKLAISAVAIVLAVATLSVSLMGCKPKPKVENADINKAIFNVGGYQSETAPNADLKEGGKIVPIQDMLTKTGIKIDKDPQKAAQYIYNMAVRNYTNVASTGYRVLTDASVKAKDVKALGIGFPTFDVGIRSTYSTASGAQGSFTQIVSGVTQLDIEGLGALGDSIRGAFGYNIQSFNNKDMVARRNGPNGGAKFLTDSEGAYKYILGGQQKKFPTTAYANEDKGFYVKAAEPSTGGGAIEPYAGNAWDPLKEYNEESANFVIDGKTYYIGSYGGAGWAQYNFAEDYLAEGTTVTYDKKSDVYTLTMKVKDDKIDDACKFAKGGLVRDTKNYIILTDPKYTKLENTIQVYGNGLIKNWVREEVMGSEQAAKLIVLPGTCNGGGSTGNKAFAVFSYDLEDSNAELMCALYCPELGNTKAMSKTGIKPLNLSKYPTIDTYNPKVWGKAYTVPSGTK